MPTKNNSEYCKNRYYWLKQHGICVECGAENAEKGRVHCRKCAKTNQEYSTIWYYKKIMDDEIYKNTHNEKVNQSIQKRREYRRENGLCTQCGKELIDKKYKKCKQCREKDNAYRKIYRQLKGAKTYEERISGKYCYQCLKPIENRDKTKGAQLCDNCKARSIAILENVRNKVKNNLESE